MIKYLAKKRGVPEEEVKLLLEAAKDRDEERIQEKLAVLAETGELISKMPQQVQQAAMPMIAQTLIPRQDRTVERIAAVAAAMRGGDEVSKMIESLKQEIQELKDEKVREEREELLKTLEEELADIRSYVDKVVSKLASREAEDKDELDALGEYLEKVERTKEKMKALGLIREKEEDDIDLSRAEEILRKAGYRVERPLTWETLQSYIEKEIQKVREEAKKEAMEELRIQEKREAMLVDLFSTISGAILDAMKGPASASGTSAEKIVERVREWKGQKQEI